MFIKGHILLHIMCFIPLTQTHYAPGWKWPYESHKPDLMNMSVKATAESGLFLRGRSFCSKACAAKMYAYKNVSGFPAAKVHLWPPNGLLFRHCKQDRISVHYGFESRQTHSVVKDLFHSFIRWVGLYPQQPPKYHNKWNYFSLLWNRCNLKVNEVKKHNQDMHEAFYCKR